MIAMILADIAHGEVDAADVMFLIAVILAVVAVVAYLATSIPDRIGAAAISAAIGLVALGFLLL